MEAPVKEGDIVKLECVGTGKTGDGIFKKDNFVVIVPNTTPGNTYIIKITTVKDKYAFGEIRK